MYKNKIIVISVFFILAVAAVAYWTRSPQNSSDDTNVSTQAVSLDSTDSTAPVATSPKVPSSSETLPTKNTTTSTSPSVYTMTTVAQHASTASCWIVVNNFVYDVTKWILRHPGGTRAIMSICGKDATTTFTGQHGGQARPESELASFKIGTLSVQ